MVILLFRGLLSLFGKIVPSFVNISQLDVIFVAGWQQS
jgi:hypothetical protein